MLDIGFLELMLIGIVALLVLGPERLPKAARTTGLWIGKIKRTVSGMQREISAQLEAEELRQKLNEQQQKLDDSLKKAKQEVESITDAPSSSRTANSAGSNSPGNNSSGASTAAKADTQDATEQRVANASARLDDALQTVREDAPAPAPSDKADQQKDSNHQ
ncbi:Sec-independent protein translocase protein TatB [Vreelandella aquamarina]|uniref:Sec-independent protein translocase protein TatB n=1 Tax=Vreelandella aquamarina TaxID=77097 RepID=UPI00384AF455